MSAASGGGLSKSRTLFSATIGVLTLLGLYWLVRSEATRPPTPSAERAADTAEAPRRGERPRNTEEVPATPPPDSNDEPKRTLRVVVVSRDDGIPVPGAVVRVGDGDPVTTDENGLASMQFAWFADVIVRKPGFQWVRRDIDHDRDPMRIELLRGVTVRARVVIHPDGVPAVRAEVHAWDAQRLETFEDAEIDETLHTDDEGRFELACVAPDRAFRVAAALTGLVTAMHTWSPGDAKEIELTLGDGGVFEGVVSGHDGRPLSGIDVFAMPGDDDRVPDVRDEHRGNRPHRTDFRSFMLSGVRTGDEGRYAIRGVPLRGDSKPAEWVATARNSAGRVVRSEAATFTQSGERAPRDIVFRRTSLTIRGVGEPKAGRTFEVRIKGHDSPERTIALVAQSPATFEDLLPDYYSVSLRVIKGDRVVTETSRRMVVRDGDQVDAEVSVEADGRISGRAVDAAGSPVSGACLTFDGEGPDWVHAKTFTAPDGSFAFESLPPVQGAVTSERTYWNDEFAEVFVPDVRPGDAPLRITIQNRASIRFRLGPAVPREGLLIAVRRFDGWTGLRTSAADDGALVAICPIVGAQTTFWIRAGDFAPLVFDDRTLVPGATLDLGELRFDEGLTFEALLRDREGRPLTGVVLVAVDWWAQHLPSFTESPPGTMRMSALPPVPLHLTVQATETTPSWRIVIKPATQTGTFTIGPGVPFAGVVVGASGAPLPEAWIHLRRREPWPSRDSEYLATTTADGRFDERVQPGRYVVEVSNRLGGRIVEPPEVDTGDDGARELVLRVR